MRARWQRYLDLFFEELQTHDVRTATIRAGRRANWCTGGWKGTLPLSDRQILKRAKNILETPDAIASARALFELAEFSVVDAVRKHVEHITTGTDKDPLGSWEALKAYEALAIPKPAKQVQVDTRMLVAHRMVTGEAPPMRARALESKPAIEGD